MIEENRPSSSGLQKKKEETPVKKNNSKEEILTTKTNSQKTNQIPFKTMQEMTSKRSSPQKIKEEDKNQPQNRSPIRITGKESGPTKKKNKTHTGSTNQSPKQLNKSPTTAEDFLGDRAMMDSSVYEEPDEEVELKTKEMNQQTPREADPQKCTQYHGTTRKGSKNNYQDKSVRRKRKEKTREVYVRTSPEQRAERLSDRRTQQLPAQPKKSYQQDHFAGREKNAISTKPQTR
ncbi:submandibular gland secretory Glx-rich protein CB-like [Ambystoma mexicanum]|uniref:submandibular gland secretory Glx-rich protein CB-like n=1 Tax=Ambystoma mexicanum TaxID=8296 RepID=UPI0037E817EC